MGVCVVGDSVSRCATSVGLRADQPDDHDDDDSGVVSWAGTAPAPDDETMHAMMRDRPASCIYRSGLEYCTSQAIVFRQLFHAEIAVFRTSVSAGIHGRQMDAFPSWERPQN
jgi:hypothetical protein